MKKLMIVIVIMALFTACGPTPTQDIQATIAIGMQQTRAAEPTATFTPEPTPDIQATINAGIMATQAAQPSPTLSPTYTATDMPSATDLPQLVVTNTPQFQASYNEFFDKYKTQFEGTKSLMSKPVTSAIHKIYFEKNELGGTILWIETTGNASDISPTLLGATIGVLKALVDDPTSPDEYVPKALPEDLELVRFVFRDEALAEHGHFFTTWTEMMDYANDRITFTTMFDKSDWILP